MFCCSIPSDALIFVAGNFGGTVFCIIYFITFGDEVLCQEFIIYFNAHTYFSNSTFVFNFSVTWADFLLSKQSEITAIVYSLPAYVLFSQFIRVGTFHIGFSFRSYHATA